MSISAAEHYRQQQILNSSPAERVVLLYDGAIRFMMITRQAIEANDIQKRFDNSQKARNVVQHLLETLDMEKGGEIAENLSNIYNYLLRQFLDVDKNSIEAVDEILKHLKILRASWAKIAMGEKEGVKDTPIDNIMA
ncbi:MAG TPA: flagellar export chaperone FliS [Alphaproteobacteria bacterium]|nr:flagellar export chaperone FliS [Alphaproteobacteria bacterium]